MIPSKFLQALEQLSGAWEQLSGKEVQVGQEDGPAALKGSSRGMQVRGMSLLRSVQALSFGGRTCGQKSPLAGGLGCDSQEGTHLLAGPGTEACEG